MRHGQPSLVRSFVVRAQGEPQYTSFDCKPHKFVQPPRLLKLLKRRVPSDLGIAAVNFLRISKQSSENAADRKGGYQRRNQRCETSKRIQHEFTFISFSSVAQECDLAEFQVELIWLLQSRLRKSGIEWAKFRSQRRRPLRLSKFIGLKCLREALPKHASDNALGFCGQCFS